MLLGLTLVQPFLRLRRPRPPLRDVVRQSGFVVCLAVIVGTLIVVDLGWVARIDVAWGAILASALLLFWPVLGLPPGVRKRAGSIASAGPWDGAGSSPRRA